MIFAKQLTLNFLNHKLYNEKNTSNDFIRADSHPFIGTKCQRVL